MICDTRPLALMGTVALTTFLATLISLVTCAPATSHIHEDESHPNHQHSGRNLHWVSFGKDSEINIITENEEAVLFGRAFSNSGIDTFSKKRIVAGDGDGSGIKINAPYYHQISVSDGDTGEEKIKNFDRDRMEERRAWQALPDSTRYARAEVDRIESVTEANELQRKNKEHDKVENEGHNTLGGEKIINEEENEEKHRVSYAQYMVLHGDVNSEFRSSLAQHEASLHVRKTGSSYHDRRKDRTIYHEGDKSMDRERNKENEHYVSLGSDDTDVSSTELLAVLLLHQNGNPDSDWDSESVLHEEEQEQYISKTLSLDTLSHDCSSHWDHPNDGPDGWCYEKKDDPNECQFVADVWATGLMPGCTFIWVKDNQCNVYDKWTNIDFGHNGNYVREVEGLREPIEFYIYQSRVPWFRYGKETHGWWDVHWHWNNRYTEDPNRQKYQHWFKCPEKKG